MIKVYGPYSKVSWEPFNLNSHTQLKTFLLSEGWVPTQFNYKLDEGGNKVVTSPKLTEDSFDSIKGDIGKLILRRSSIKHRRDFVENKEDPGNRGLLAYVNGPEDRVSANAITLGTPTHRYTHVAPVCNTPSAGALYGLEVRSLFRVLPPYLLLGADKKQIEMRVAAHYAYPYDGGKLLQQVLHGDFHQDVADNVYHCSRGHGKGATYGILYGCGIAKLAQYLGISFAQAKIILENFWLYNVGLGKLKGELEAAYSANGGWIRGLDGRKIFIRGKHKLLNSLIQSTAAVLFKRWMVNVSHRFEELLLDAHIIIAYHDELQVEVHEKDVDCAAWILHEEAEKLQGMYNLNAPVEASVAIGMNWAETH